MQNTVAFPLGLTKHKTPAASPLPGHLLASLGPAGHAAAVAAMGVAGLAFAAWLLLRPPKTAQAVAWRLAVGYAGMFTLAPATRFGYFAYPLCLLGWLCLTRGVQTNPLGPPPSGLIAVVSGYAGRSPSVLAGLLRGSPDPRQVLARWRSLRRAEPPVARAGSRR
jgi:hypothetical protein